MNEELEAARKAIEREDFGAASSLLLPLAEAGVAEAQYLLGFFYFNYLEGKPQESHAWLEKAAAQGHAEALRCLAMWRSDVLYGMPDDENSRALLIKAAELGSIQAQRD